MTQPPTVGGGLQPERTALAWRRTTLSLVLGSLVSLRILPPVLGAWSLVVAAAGLVLCVVLWGAARRRSKRTVGALQEGRVLPDGRLALATGLVVAAAGLLALSFVLHPVVGLG